MWHVATSPRNGLPRLALDEAPQGPAAGAPGPLPPRLGLAQPPAVASVEDEVLELRHCPVAGLTPFLKEQAASAARGSNIIDNEKAVESWAAAGCHQFTSASSQTSASQGFGPDVLHAQQTATVPGVGAACSLDGKTGVADPWQAFGEVLPEDHLSSNINDGMDWDDGGLGYCYASEEEDYDPDDPANDRAESWDSGPSTGNSADESHLLQGIDMQHGSATAKGQYHELEDEIVGQPKNKYDLQASHSKVAQELTGKDSIGVAAHVVKEPVAAAPFSPVADWSDESKENKTSHREDGNTSSCHEADPLPNVFVLCPAETFACHDVEERVVCNNTAFLATEIPKWGSWIDEDFSSSPAPVTACQLPCAKAKADTEQVSADAIASGARKLHCIQWTDFVTRNGARIASLPEVKVKALSRYRQWTQRKLNCDIARWEVIQACHENAFIHGRPWPTDIHVKSPELSPSVLLEAFCAP